MKICRIRKRSGKFRVIAVPGEEQKLALRALVGPLTDRAAKLDHDGVMHGFARGRSPVTAAREHVGRRYTLAMDLTDFFDGVTAAHLRGKIDAATLGAIMPAADLDGRSVARCWQGLPTSPAAANIAAAAMDEAIARRIAKLSAEDRISYTRYADDLAFSFDRPETRAMLMIEIPQIVSRCGWRINAAKTRFMPASAGRREICGVLIDADGALHPRRSTRRKLRAALHQHRAESARGLAEWCKLISPKTPQQRVAIAAAPTGDELAVARARDEARRERERVMRALCRHWDLRECPTPDGAQADVADGDYLITRDPAYMLGMSSYTTGWISCMAQPSGAHRKSVRFWCALPGTSVAALLSSRTATHAGVTRRVMRARCLLHRMRDGRTAYDRLYGDEQSMAALREWLTARGCIPVSSLRTGDRVAGNVPRTIPQPWADTMHFRAMRDGERKVWVAKK